MNNQEILTRVIDAIRPYEAIEKARDSRDVNPWSVACDMHERLAALRDDLQAQIRWDIARNAGNGNAARTIRAFLKAVKKDARESLHYPWIDSEGRECYCDGYRAFRLNNPLRLVERPENAGETINLARIYPDSLAGWKELPMPTIAEIKTHIALAKANGSDRRSALWRFGPGKPTVRADYLLDAATVFPDAEKIFWNTLVSPLMIQGRDGDGLILPIRVKDEVQPEPASDDERKAIEAYDAKVEANREAAKERTQAICKAHDKEHEANVEMDQAAARCKVLEEGVKNASNEVLKSGLMEQLAGARREYALATLKRHAAILEYDPTEYISAEQFEFLAQMMYDDNAA